MLPSSSSRKISIQMRLQLKLAAFTEKLYSVVWKYLEKSTKEYYRSSMVLNIRIL